MHEKSILHRDIRSANILCDESGEIKISNLGFSVCLTNAKFSRNTRIGTNQWISPEIINRKPYSREVDVWAFGIFAYELACGGPPFEASRS